MKPSVIKKEVAGVYLGVSLVVWLLSQLPLQGWLAELIPVAIAFVFLWTSLRMVQKHRGHTSRFGIHLGGWLLPLDENQLVHEVSQSHKTNSETEVFSSTSSEPEFCSVQAKPTFQQHPVSSKKTRFAGDQEIREVLAAFSIAILVFPMFAIGFWFWFEPHQSFSFQFTPDFPIYFFTQLVVVALPEEVFFRGYIQTRLSDIWPLQTRIFGVVVSLRAWFLQALLFAVMHFVVTLDVTRLAVFFPGLLFGWVRRWRHGIGAAIVLHALSNLLSYVLALGWF